MGAINIFKAIFSLFWFILKQICLFRLFQNTFETPKQTETKFSLVLKMNRNKRETDPVSVIFGSNRNFFYSFRGHPMPNRNRLADSAKLADGLLIHKKVLFTFAIGMGFASTT